MRAYSTWTDDYRRRGDGYVQCMESTPTPPHQDPRGTQSVGDSGAPKPHREIGGKKFRVGSGDTYVPFRSRSRRRRRKMIIAGTAAAALLAVAGYGITSLISSPRTTTAAAAALPNCPEHTTRAPNGQLSALPSSARITVNVYNATNRNGLAASTAALLKQRGFVIGKVTNDPLKSNLAQSAQVRGSAAEAAEMRVVAAEVPGTGLRPDTRTDHTVDLVLGGAFTALATPAQATAVLAAAVAGARPGTAACVR
jgi:hypothetical protein